MPIFEFTSVLSVCDLTFPAAVSSANPRRWIFWHTLQPLTVTHRSVFLDVSCYHAHSFGTSKHVHASEPLNKRESV